MYRFTSLPFAYSIQRSASESKCEKSTSNTGSNGNCEQKKVINLINHVQSILNWHRLQNGKQRKTAPMVLMQELQLLLLPVLLLSLFYTANVFTARDLQWQKSMRTQIVFNFFQLIQNKWTSVRRVRRSGEVNVNERQVKCLPASP